MGKTRKDLKSHKKGFGRYGFNKPKRKMTPLLLTAEKVTGKKGNHLSFEKTDISQDDFMYDEKNPRKNRNPYGHWHNAKSVKSIRKQDREERKRENKNARSRMKRQLNKITMESE